MPITGIERSYCKSCKKSLQKTEGKETFCRFCFQEWSIWNENNQELNLKFKINNFKDDNFDKIHNSSYNNPPTAVLKNKHFNDYIGLYDNKIGDYFILPEPLKALQTGLVFPEKIFELETENKGIHQFYSKNYYLAIKLYNKYVKKEIEVFIFSIPILVCFQILMKSLIKRYS